MGEFSYCCSSAQNTHEKWLKRLRRQLHFSLWRVCVHLGKCNGGGFVVVVCVPAQKETGDDERMDAIFNLGAYHRRTM